MIDFGAAGGGSADGEVLRVRKWCRVRGPCHRVVDTHSGVEWEQCAVVLDNDDPLMLDTAFLIECDVELLETTVGLVEVDSTDEDVEMIDDGAAGGGYVDEVQQGLARLAELADRGVAMQEIVDLACLADV